MSCRRAAGLIVQMVLIATAGCRGCESTAEERKPVSSASDEDLAYPTLVARSMEDLRIRTGSFQRLFQIGASDWFLDQDERVITFTSPEGIVATAPAQIAGTYNTEDNTWLWAWRNSSIDPALTAHSTIVRQYGERRKIAELTTAKLEISEEKAWELAALTCKLGQFQGVYRGPSGPTMVFITFGGVQLKKVGE